MIRITELQLPLAEKSVENTPEELRVAILKRLGIEASSLIDFSVFKRSYDARKKNDVIVIPARGDGVRAGKCGSRR